MYTIDAARKFINDAKKPEDVFGADPDMVKAAYRKLATMLHPDRFVGTAEHAEVTALFSRLNQLHVEAETFIAQGTYGKTRAPSAPVAPKTAFPVTVKTPKHEYVLTELLAEGTIANVYACGGKVLKVAQNAGDNDLMENEAKVLHELYPAAQPDVEYFRHLPKLYDTFMLGSKGSPGRRVNVLGRADGMLTLADVHKHYPDGLDFRDLAWMVRRVLAALGFIHRKGFVHGGINLDHILVHPTEHGAKLVDWTSAVKIGDVIRSVDNRTCRPYEVGEKKPASAATDIYQAAYTFSDLLKTDGSHGGAAVAKFFLGCLLDNPARRPQDAWALLDEFTELLDLLVGKPTYRPLAITAT